MVSNRNVQYIDFGYTTAEQHWREVAWPAYERFKSAPGRQAAIEASVPAWHIHEWLWHERNPGENTRGNHEFQRFKSEILRNCPQLGWIRDVADASKHRGLGRPLEVHKISSRRQYSGATGSAPMGVLPMASAGPTRLAIVLNDGTTHDFANVLSRVMDYWQENWFST